MKMKQFGLTETKLFHFHMIFSEIKLFHFHGIFNNGGGAGARANPLTPLWIRQ